MILKQVLSNPLITKLILKFPVLITLTHCIASTFLPLSRYIRL